MEPYIIWDWNGTLLDDVDVAVRALNAMLSVRGISPTTRDYYRAHFGFPVRPFYAQLGVDLSHEDWDQICQDFHRAVRAQPQVLRTDALEALACAREAGIGQSLLSALREDFLRHDTAALGVAPFLDAVWGVDNLDGATKLDRGRELVAFLAERARRQAEVGPDGPSGPPGGRPLPDPPAPPPNRMVGPGGLGGPPGGWPLPKPIPDLYFVGDTLHDAEVARALGAHCVLVDGGHQTAERLTAAGVPVVASLTAAVQLISSQRQP